MLKLVKVSAGVIPAGFLNTQCFSMNKLLAVLLLLVLIVNVAFAKDTPGIELRVIKKNMKLKVYTLVPKGTKQVEIRLFSSRNLKIDRYTDISPLDPKRDEITRNVKVSPREIWYPIVDIVREPGLEGVMQFGKKAKGKVLINGPFIREKSLVESRTVVPASDLAVWENTMVVEPADCEVLGFYLRKAVPVVMRKVEHSFSLLSENWQGNIELYEVTHDGYRKLVAEKVEETYRPATKGTQGKGIEKARLMGALKATIDFTLGAQIDDPGSPVDGGLFLFYDLDAKTYRNSYWMWGWGPSIKMLLDAAKLSIEGLNPDDLQSAAEEIGRVSMRFQFLDETQTLNQVRIGRWGQSVKKLEVYSAAITIADNQFLSGWAWIPLYELTGAAYFLDAARNLCRATDALMDKFKIIPHSYFPEEDRWYDFTICETGFGLEGLAEIYRVTKDDRYRETGRRFIEQHQNVFQREDGLWEREYNLKTGKVTPTEHHTRGQGWAMEGLLAAHRLMPEGDYLEHAKRMAEQMIKMQQPEGCWTFYSHLPAEEVGISEKGTALWSYLLYRLYDVTGDIRHLESARKALLWCLDNQYFGSDAQAYGSIPGSSPQSAVGYRRWFKVSCVYTSGFFGLALMEELKL